MSSLKSFDFYPKLNDEFKVKTLSGGLVSLIALATIFILFISELSYYLTTEITDTLSVDVSRGEKIDINFDVTFPHIPCPLLVLDAMDISGSHQLGVDHHIVKQPLDRNGVPIGNEEYHKLGQSTMSDADMERYHNAAHNNLTRNELQQRIQAPGYCGSCYGAGSGPNACCNSCAEVRQAYRNRGWSMPPLNTIEQCVAAGETSEEGAHELEQQQGCRMSGYLTVNKVAGNFHFAPGKSFEIQSMHIHDLAMFPNGFFNVSHVIHHMSFGANYPGQVNPLDGIVENLSEGNGDTTGMFMYYSKVVPTTYNYLNGTTTKTNQFSATTHYRTLRDASGGNGLPGVFIFYELSPIMVVFNEERKSFFHFITQLCAILGGVFTVSGMIDRLVYVGVNVAQKQRQGKLK